MKLKDLILSDGRIKGIEMKDGVLALSFRDYLNYDYIIRFTGNVEYTDNDCTGVDISKDKLSKIGKNRYRLILADAEEEFLRVEFDEATVEEL